jgi:hypothetical protein
VFRNIGIKNSDAGELPRRKHTTVGILLRSFISLAPFHAL